MGLTEKEVDDLILRAEKFKGKIWVIRNKKFKFLRAGEADVEDKNKETYNINGNLMTDEGDMLTKPLKKIVEHFEKNEAK